MKLTARGMKDLTRTMSLAQAKNLVAQMKAAVRFAAEELYCFEGVATSRSYVPHAYKWRAEADYIRLPFTVYNGKAYFKAAELRDGYAFSVPHGRGAWVTGLPTHAPAHGPAAEARHREVLEHWSDLDWMSASQLRARDRKAMASK